MTETKAETTGSMPLQVFKLFRDYRCYITPEYYLITYQDADLVRVFRIPGHRPGFLLLIVDILFENLRGRRTALRERWALWNQDYDRDAEKLGLQCRAAERQVLEFDFENQKPKPKELS